MGQWPFSQNSGHGVAMEFLILPCFIRLLVSPEEVSMPGLEIDPHVLYLLELKLNRNGSNDSQGAFWVWGEWNL